MNRLDGAIRQLIEEFARSVACHGMWEHYTIEDMRDAMAGEWAEVQKALRLNDIHGEHGVIAEALQLSCVALKSVIVLSSLMIDDDITVAVKSYEQLGREIGALTDVKNASYGNSFDRAGNVLREFYPQGVSPEKMDEMLGLVRIIDKGFRIATDRDAFGESPWRDIAGYGLLGAMRAELRS